MVPIWILLYLICDCGCNNGWSYYNGNNNNCCYGRYNNQRYNCNCGCNQRNYRNSCGCDHDDYDNDCGCTQNYPNSIDKGCGCDDDCIQPRGYL